MGDAPEVDGDGAAATGTTDRPTTDGGIRAVSFEDTFEAEARETYGDLGPTGDSRDDRGEKADSGNRGGRRRHR